MKFNTDAEMLSFKADFQAALGFIQKLNDVDVENVEPLGNVWEIYRGNQDKIRDEEDMEEAQHMIFD